MGTVRQRHSERIESLLLKLADDALAWRRSRPDSIAEREALDSYQRTMEELFRMGDWCGEPEVDSLLPNDLMPAVYKEFWRKKLGD